MVFVGLVYPLADEFFLRGFLLGGRDDGQPVRRAETQMTRPALYLVLLLTSSVSLACLPDPAAIDARVRAAMAETRAKRHGDRRDR